MSYTKSFKTIISILWKEHKCWEHVRCEKHHSKQHHREDKDVKKPRRVHKNSSKSACKKQQGNVQKMIYSVASNFVARKTHGAIHRSLLASVFMACTRCHFALDTSFPLCKFASICFDRQMFPANSVQQARGMTICFYKCVFVPRKIQR